MFQQLDSPFLLLLGIEEPLSVDLGELQRRLEVDGMTRDLVAMGTPNAASFLAHFRLGPDSTRALVAAYEPVRDDRTIIDYTSPLHAGSGFGLLPVGRGYRRAREYRMDEYTRWRDPISLIVPDARQAAEVQRIRSAGYR